jgi:hypothetical protein
MPSDEPRRDDAHASAHPGVYPNVYADPYASPATGSASPAATELPPDEQPVVTGTLFLMMIFLMMIAGFWGIMYYLLLNR